MTNPPSVAVDRGQPILVGCAGWNLPRDRREQFPEEGTHLQRYAARFPVVEINSSFYRPHRTATYARWAASAPEAFRFAVKVPKTMTHERRLQDCGESLGEFLAQVEGLGEKLGCFLVQLPPSLAFDRQVARDFFADLRRRSTAAIVCEPRHASWFNSDTEQLLIEHNVARVAADPAPCLGAEEPGGSNHVIYYRLHGSPRTYYSAYDDAFLAALAARLRGFAAAGRPVWCIFDNTALGAATRNALDLITRLAQ